MKRGLILALAAVVVPACSKSSGGSGAVPAAPAARAAAAAGADQKAVPGYSTSFAVLGGWTLDAAMGGVGWAMDGTPAAPRTGAESLNYNDGVDFDSGGANSGAATSPEIGIAGHTSPALVFWCNYSTETTGTAKDKRWLRVSADNFVNNVINQQLAGTATAPYQCGAMGAWHRHVVPLNPDWGRIKVRFFFESIDAANNAGAGWAIDDLSVDVRLSAKGSSDPAGAVTYEWVQTGGTPVTLSDATAQEPHFLAPALANSAQDLLVFSLTVTGPSGTDVDTVRVQLKSLLIGAPDTWFAGYGLGGSVTAKVAGTPAGALTYEWTGIEPWLAVSGAASDILTYTAPALTDFQNFPDRADVALLERTSQGRLQLKVVVRDGGVPVDEDLVNFSVGPFADAMANENLGLGEPAFLNGGATVPVGSSTTPVTTWAWIGRKPNGLAVSFFRPDKTPLAGATNQRYVYFVPDLPGDYEIEVTQNDTLASETTKFLFLTSGSYVGVGNRAGAPPDPFKGECASCHGGQFGWLADYATPWGRTGHAAAFERLLDPVNPLFAPSQAKGRWEDAFNFGSPHSIDSRTVGFSRITAGTNDGWAKRATDAGFVFGEASHAELVRKHPSVAALSGVQCESCHGPGSEHRADTTGIRKSFDSGMCSRCHAAEAQHWEASSHGKPPIVSPSGNTSCNNCHTAQGFVVEMRAQHGAEPHTALFGVGNLARPVIPYEDRRGTTCQACHDPHERTAKRGTPAGEPDPQLRAFGNVKFRNDVVTNAGNAASCYMCHQSRTDTRAGSTDLNSRRAPHDGTSAEMLAATNAYEFPGWVYSSSPHGIPSRFVSPLFGENRQCLACHKDASPVVGAPGHGVLGGHTFAMKQGTGTGVADETSHAGAQIVAGTRKFSVASGPTFLRSLAPGDVLIVNPGPGESSFPVAAVDGARQLTLGGAAALPVGAVADWSVTSPFKYNTASCTQCHTTAGDFRDIARGDYDNDLNSTEPIQDEIDGLIATLTAEIQLKLVAYTGVAAATLEPGSGRIKYRTTPTVTRTFPGPSVTASDNPDIPWSSLTELQKTQWTTLYQAAYNISFVKNDKSHGIHNTGYAVNVLQSSIEAVTGVPYPAAKRFVPFP